MKKRIFTKRRIFLTIIVVLLGIQFIRIDKSQPPFNPVNDIISITQPEAELAATFKSACYDCHSYETEYPWYADIAPVSWWLKKHINEAREALNFSEWGNLTNDEKGEKVEEAIDMIEKRWMPIGSFKLMHPEARLTDVQRKAMVEWMKSTL